MDDSGSRESTLMVRQLTFAILGKMFCADGASGRRSLGVDKRMWVGGVLARRGREGAHTQSSGTV